MYNEKVMEIFKNPKNVGEVENYNAIGTVGNATCGDIMQITLRIEDGIIKDAITELNGLPPQKIHCSVLAEEAIKAAIDSYRQNQGNGDVSATVTAPCACGCGVQTSGESESK